MSSNDGECRKSVFHDDRGPLAGGKNLLPAGNELLTPRSGGSTSAGCSIETFGAESTSAETTSSTDYAETVNGVELPEPVVALADDYDEVFGERDRFLWRWIYSLLPEFTLSSVADEHVEQVRVQKTILTMFVTLLDDLAEKRGDVRTFDRICRMIHRFDDVRTARPGVDTEVVSLAERIWTAFESSLEAAPRHDRYQEVFEYDLRQATNAMEYSRLVNEHLSMANLAGLGHYGPHNMIMFPYADVDLMYSPSFDETELGAVRELIWDLQKMARIGNWLTTWERELQEGDCSAGVIVYAIQQDVVSVDDVEAPDQDRRAAAARRIKNQGIEDEFLEEWWRLYRSVVDDDLEAETVDLDDFVAGMESVMAHHMASRGHK